MTDVIFIPHRLRGVAVATSFWAESAKLAYTTFIRRSGIPNRLEHRNADVKRLTSISDDPSIHTIVLRLFWIWTLLLCQVLQKFGEPVTPQFTRLDCVQQASISTLINSTTFTRGSTAKLGGLHSRLCRAFSSFRLIPIGLQRNFMLQCRWPIVVPLLWYCTSTPLLKFGIKCFSDSQKAR